MKQYLKVYQSDLKYYLIDGFDNGFQLDNIIYTPVNTVKKLTTALQRPEMVDLKLEKANKKKLTNWVDCQVLMITNLSLI
jgi:hypothetical protein